MPRVADVGPLGFRQFPIFKDTFADLRESTGIEWEDWSADFSVREGEEIA